MAKYIVAGSKGEKLFDCLEEAKKYLESVKKWHKEINWYGEIFLAKIEEHWTCEGSNGCKEVLPKPDDLTKEINERRNNFRKVIKI